MDKSKSLTLSWEFGVAARSLCVSNHTDTSHEYLITMAGSARSRGGGLEGRYA